MIGAMPMRIEGRRWIPDDDANGRAFVSPLRSRGTPWDLLAEEIVINGPLIDLVAWHPGMPHRWATRCGAAGWLGAWDPGISAQRTDPVPIWRGPFAWLLGWMTGVVPLVTDRVALYRLLADMPVILAEDEAHARQLRRALERPYPVPLIDWRRP
jgi:hypothetical protein